MGFFNDLKEDLAQAVNELAEDTVEKEMQTEEEKLAEEVNQMKADDDVTDQTDIQEETDANADDDKSAELSDLEKQLKEYLESDSIVVPAEESQDDAEESEKKEEAKTESEIVIAKEEAEKKETTENDRVKGEYRRMEAKGKSATDETAIITAGMIITGDVCSEGSIDIIGSIVGNIDILGKLNVTGTIQGNSKATEVYAENAHINGEIVSKSSVKIGSNSVVIGNIVANSAVIAGAVKGDIDVHGPVILDTSAIVMGDIKSRSVQINNGAVIEGMCSQCYAEINPTSFFENITKSEKSEKKSK